jgi:hypothetical protein
MCRVIEAYLQLHFIISGITATYESIVPHTSPSITSGLIEHPVAVSRPIFAAR